MKHKGRDSMTLRKFNKIKNGTTDYATGVPEEFPEMAEFLYRVHYLTKALLQRRYH
jgi:hypothetical protein